eukprot:gene17168-17361_t
MARQRVFVAGSLVAVAYLLICGRLVDVMVLRSSKNVSHAISEQITTLRRADIIDRNGEILATHLVTASIYANPKVILNAKEAAEKLAKVLPEVGFEVLYQRLSSAKGFVWLARHLPPKLQQAINQMGIPGVYLQKDHRRVYPYGKLASHVLGYCGIDSNGLAGVEKHFDAQLQKSNEPLQLSIDVRVQHVVYDEMSKAITEFGAIGGNAMVMDLQSGELISMVSFPGFDPNQPTQGAQDATFNRNTLGVFEPEFGIATQKAYLKKFGIFKAATLEIPELGHPLIPTTWREPTSMTVSYGYGISVTPLQLISTIGEVIKANKAKEPIVSEKTSRIIRDLMRIIVREGPSKKANVDGYQVIGKTGTAYKIQGKSYATDDPKPTKNTYGFAAAGWNAAPTAGKIIERMAPILDVESNDLFVSVHGPNSFIYAQSALEKGAKVFISNQETCEHFERSFPDVTFIPVSNPRLTFTKLVQVIYPGQPQTIIAVTGTNGKSSVVNMLRQLWEFTGIPAARNRDTGKRPQMGKIAQDLADKIIVTDDNPRLEDPASIRSEILKACPKAKEIGNRAEAIAVAIAGLRISIDTRTLKPGELYIAIKGDSLDGHDFVKDAFAKGASGVVVSKFSGDLTGKTYFLVDDTLKALNYFGAYARAKTAAKIVGITGSVGKTTTKEWLAHVLAAFGKTTFSKESYNNHWGVPLSLIALENDTEFGVFEVGMNKPGEIEPLSRLVEPDVAVITTIAESHIGHFESLEQIAAEKAEIFSGLKTAKSKGITNIIGVGKTKGVDIQLIEYKENAFEYTSSITAEIKGEKIQYQLPLIGEHYAFTSLVVLACVNELGLSLEKAAKTLLTIKPIRGEMLELGVKTPEYHRDLVDAVKQSGTNLVFGTGAGMQHLFDVLPKTLQGRFEPKAEALIPYILPHLQDGDIVFVKGSKGNFLLNLGYGYFIWAILVIVGSSNAVNLTDGLDGLAIVPVMIAATCFCLISYVVGLGFLWFNAPPAKVFMGDTGSLAAGGALGTVAVITKHEIVLAIVGGLFVIEAVSVILQEWLALVKQQLANVSLSLLALQEQTANQQQQRLLGIFLTKTKETHLLAAILASLPFLLKKLAHTF